MSRLEVAGLTVAYDDVDVVSDLDFALDDTRISSILGPSGCGKTTLLRTIAGFLRPKAGLIRIGTTVVAGGASFVPPERRGVGIVPQEGALFPHLTVGGNVEFGLTRTMPSRDRDARVRQLLELVGLPGSQALRPAELSGGMQQRVALARALAPSPALLLLDEPFSALDAGLRTSLRTEVRDLLVRTGTTAVLVTHDQEEALSFADEVAVMRHGRIVQKAAPDIVYARPVDIDTARFVGNLVEVPGVAAGGTVRTALGSHLLIDPSVNGPCIVALRPEQITIASGSAGDETSGTGRVESITFFGHDHLVEVRMPDGSRVEARQGGAPRQRRGDRVRVDVLGTVSAFATSTP
jgi:iron(III) transport system ATP-binding protein